mgnify:FL=1
MTYCPHMLSLSPVAIFGPTPGLDASAAAVATLTPETPSSTPMLATNREEDLDAALVSLLLGWNGDGLLSDAELPSTDRGDLLRCNDRR